MVAVPLKLGGEEMFIIPEIQPPDTKAISANCLRSYERVSWSYIDKWPDAWRTASMETDLVPLDLSLVDVMWGAHDGHRIDKLDPLAREVDALCDWQSRFIRLNSRSPKDVIDKPITCAGRQALTWLISSDRTMDDLTVFKNADRPCFIALRKVQHFMPELEVRCFVTGGQLQAATQYFYDRPLSSFLDKEWRAETWKKIDAFFQSVIVPETELNELVFDVHVGRSTDQPMLIEVNPYGLSDPCAAQTYDQIEQQGGWFWIPPPPEEKE